MSVDPDVPGDVLGDGPVEVPVDVPVDVSEVVVPVLSGVLDPFVPPPVPHAPSRATAVSAGRGRGILINPSSPRCCRRAMAGGPPRRGFAPYPAGRGR
ncbi:MAG: hypothetical protein WB473_03445 [Pedococcus sp.]